MVFYSLITAMSYQVFPLESKDVESEGIPLISTTSFAGKCLASMNRANKGIFFDLLILSLLLSELSR